MVAELFLSAILQVLFDRSTPHAKDLWKLAQREGLEKKLETLLDLFRENEAVLADAEEKQLTQHTVKLWLNMLKDMVYDAEDVLDEFSTESLRLAVANQQAAAATSNCFKLLPDLKFKIKMGVKINAIISKLKENSKQIDKLSLMVCGEAGGANGPTFLWPTLPSTPLSNEIVIHGRDKDKKFIIDLLMAGDKRCDVIPIVAMGGAGKTTLAQHVYEDQHVALAFQTKAWVCVSNDFDVIRLMKEILVRTTDQHRELNDFQSIEAKLKEALGGQRFLIVLDDIWDHTFVNDKWLKMESLLRIGAPGSKMIVTTRQEEVADKIGTIEPYMLKLLSNDDCWLLFKTHAFKRRGVDEPPNLELIRKNIVELCDGLPLAAKTLGGLLCSEPSDRWDRILNNKILSMPQEQGDVLNVLRLSYYYLPPHLKKCFAYCAIFPQDYEFTEEELVLLWVAEGLIQQKEGREHLIQEGLMHFRGLVSKSLFQASNNDGSKYTMHDLVHDLAKEVGGELYFLLNDVSESHKEIGRARHFSFITRDYDISKRFEIFLQTKHLRTFLPFQMTREHHQYASCSVLNLPFRLKKLRVLSFHGYQITELSDSIGNLKHLRYLDLSSTKIRCLPETTCSLQNLLILSLRDCEKLRALPSKMGNLINLLYLDITNADRLQEMPIGLKELKSLQILSNFVVGKSNGCGLKELRKFMDLSGELRISRLNFVVDAREAKEASLDKKNNLKALALEWSSYFNDSRDLETRKSVIDMLRPNQNLKELTIIKYDGNTFSTWLGDPLFSCMKMLKLEDCKLCTCLPPLGQLPSLVTLQIKGMHGVKSVGAEFYGNTHSKTFPSLESLSFEDMPNWENWSDFDVNEHAEGFSCLSVLSIMDCLRLSGNLPKHFPSLKELVVYRCKSMNVVISNFPKLHVLDIDDCLELISKSIPSTIESLTIKRCLAPGRFPKTLCYLTCLRKLQINGCSRLVSLSNALFVLPLLEIVDLDDLPNLRIAIDEVNDSVSSGSCLTMTNKELKILRCPSLVCILTRGRLPTSLTNLVISCCPRLEFVTETFVENTKLESIKIIDCENFQRLAEGMRSLDHLKYIELRECPNLLSFPQGGLASNKLEAFKIRECKKLKALPDGIGSITSLVRLDIKNCEGMKFMAKEGLFSNLKELNFEECPEMEGILTNLPIFLTLLRINTCRKLISLRSLPIHLVALMISRCEEMTSIPNIPNSLTKLSIYDCPKLTTLPNNLSTSSLITLCISDCENIENMISSSSSNSFRNLTSLQNLEIWKCRKLTTLPNNLSTFSLITLEILECEEITSIPDIPISLTKLDIDKCPKLMSLPNLPNNLIKLTISCCKEMTSIPNIPNSLIQLFITKCRKLTTLPNHLFTSSLVELNISDCGEMTSIPNIPISLIKLTISNCENMENMKSSSSSNSFRNLTSLRELQIINCPKLKSLPKEGLPPSLLRLQIEGCPLLRERCKRDKGKDWNKIADIPYVHIDWKFIYDTDFDSE